MTLCETDVESVYRVRVNDDVIGEFTNPETEEGYSEAHFRIDPVTLDPNDSITVESNAAANGKIPEGDETAYSRGLWIGWFYSRG